MHRHRDDQRLGLAFAVLLVSLGLASVEAADDAHGGNLIPHPLPPCPREEITALLPHDGPEHVSRPLHILWLSGPEDHGGGEHDYIRIQETFLPLLARIPKITVEAAFGFPTQEQFDRADLLIQYLHLPELTDDQFAWYRSYVHRGGAVFSIHESCIMRPVDRATRLAECLGCAWAGDGVSQWSKFGQHHLLRLNTKHPVFHGLPESLPFNDESYWNLQKRPGVDVIAAVVPQREPTPAARSTPPSASTAFADVLAASDTRGDAFWTYEQGRGRVIGTTTGHYTYIFHDPRYRVLLVRCMAWALRENPTAFGSLVFAGLETPDGLIGTTDTMLNYTNRG